ncbi:MAG: HAD family hydrolase [Candidatus Hodarchaeota archaeon]
MKESLDSQIKAILFDLDGTLLEINLELFVSNYLKLLAQSVAHVIPPKKFIAKILKASKAVEENNGRKTNIETYSNAFFPLEGHSREEIEPFFDEFYVKDFPNLQQYARRKPGARTVVQTAFDKGYDVVIATNPLLPLTAIEQRLEWAGVPVEDFPYRLITTIENSRATKSLTNLHYYEQILKTIGYAAESCLMVGNENKDMIAGQLGMKTFLILNSNEESHQDMLVPTYKGELIDLLDLL